MNIKIGYYPVLDMMLALRQSYDSERFKPFSEVMESINGRLTEEDHAFIHTIGDSSDGWKDIISNLINITLSGLSNPEEFMLSLEKNPDLLFQIFDSNISIDRHIKNLWRNCFSSEIAKNNRLIFDRVMDISSKVNATGFMGYIMNHSDRYKKINENRVRVLIKPEHIIEVNKMENVIIMPSIFASRSITFWFNGNSYIFYVSTDHNDNTDVEPSDMIMLKCLAFNDKTRLKMLRMLHLSNYSVAEMAEKLRVNSSTVSRHFKVFKDSGFVDIFSQEGNSIYYSLNKREIKNSFETILKFIEGEDESDDKNI